MNGHHSKAKSILKKISASNNIELSEKILQQQEEVVSCIPKEVSVLNISGVLPSRGGGVLEDCGLCHPSTLAAMIWVFELAINWKFIFLHVRSLIVSLVQQRSCISFWINFRKGAKSVKWKGQKKKGVTLKWIVLGFHCYMNFVWLFKIYLSS